MIVRGPTVELSLPQPANALNLRVSQLLEAEVGGNLQKTGSKAEISSDFIILGFWENSAYSSYTPVIFGSQLLCPGALVHEAGWQPPDKFTRRGKDRVRDCRCEEKSGPYI